MKIENGPLLKDEGIIVYTTVGGSQIVHHTFTTPQSSCRKGWREEKCARIKEYD